MEIGGILELVGEGGVNSKSEVLNEFEPAEFALIFRGFAADKRINGADGWKAQVLIIKMDSSVFEIKWKKIFKNWKKSKNPRNFLKFS